MTINDLELQLNQRGLTTKQPKSFPDGKCVTGMDGCDAPTETNAEQEVQVNSTTAWQRRPTEPFNLGSGIDVDPDNMV